MPLEPLPGGCFWIMLTRWESCSGWWTLSPLLRRLVRWSTYWVTSPQAPETVTTPGATSSTRSSSGWCIKYEAPIDTSFLIFSLFFGLIYSTLCQGVPSSGVTMAERTPLFLSLLAFSASKPHTYPNTLSLKFVKSSLKVRKQ